MGDIGSNSSSSAVTRWGSRSVNSARSPSAAPLDHVGQRLAIQGDLGRNHRKVARLLEAEDLAHIDVPVGELVGDAQAVRIDGLLVPGKVDIDEGLLEIGRASCRE